MKLSNILLLSTILLFFNCAFIDKYVEERLPRPHYINENNQKGIIFLLRKNNARKVNIAGNFNDWCGLDSSQHKFDDSIGKMYRNAKGIWEIVIPLDPGTYKYKFVIDENEWIGDPSNSSSTDEEGNSIITVYHE